MFTTETLQIGNNTYTRSNNGSWKLFLGYVIQYGNRYYSWNSFKCQPRLSKLDHSEIFFSIESANKWKEKYNINYGKIIELVSYKNPSLIG